MATELSLKSRTGASLGSFDQVKTKLTRVLPDLEFYWTASGPQKLQVAAERGIALPPAIKKSLESLPALFEARHSAPGLFVLIGLGASEPVQELFVQLRGDNDAALDGIASALEREFDAQMGVAS